MSVPGATGPGTGTRTTVGVVTIVSGRRRHLHRQLEGLARQQRAADQVVIVRMDDDPVDVPPGLSGSPASPGRSAPPGRADASNSPASSGRSARSDLSTSPAPTVLDVPAVDGRLPLAAARNAGVRALGTDVAVLLDVDCIPGAGLVAGYAAAADQVQMDGADGLLCGVLRYLSPGVPGDGDWDERALVAGSHPHAARPLPGPGELLRADRHELAWTTSLGLRTETFRRIGGFDERFTGYGGEDTDFGVRAGLAGLGVWWTGDAAAYHQHHDSENPPRRHVADIVRNAQLFADLHGWYPMTGWLEAFHREGLVDFDPSARRLHLLVPA